MYAPEHLTEKRFEKYKAALRPCDWLPQMESLDFDNLAESDRVYLQDFGVFNSELEEESYMLRVRVSGGRVSAEAFAAVAELVGRYDLTLLLTARSGMQLHGIEPGDILALFKAVNALEGLTTWQTFGDNVRNIVTDPYDGRGRSCRIEAYGIIRRIEEGVLGNPDLVGMLPRRISIGITGMEENAWPLFSNDVFLGLARRGDRYGFNLYLGGKNTESARSADIFVTEEKAAKLALAVVEAFWRHGPREKRMKSRLFHMIEHYGFEKVREMVLEIYGEEVESAGESQLKKRAFGDEEPLADGTTGYRYHTNFGIVEADEAARIAEWAKAHGAELRIGIDQQLYILGVGGERPDFKKRPTSATVLACAGSEYCPFSFWSIKEEAGYLPQERLEAHNVKVGFSGCMKGCGRHKHADIGIVGLRNSRFGDDDRSARIFLGVRYTRDARPAEAVLRSVPARALHETVSLLLDLYETAGEGDFESYWARMYDHYGPEFLEYYLLARLSGTEAPPLDRNGTPEGIAAAFEGCDHYAAAKEQGWAKGADSIAKAMWHVEKVATVKHVDPSKRRSR
ncbi:nitrite/sulfite reductase [Hydrogenimonas sp.]